MKNRYFDDGAWWLMVAIYVGIIVLCVVISMGV